MRWVLAAFYLLAGVIHLASPSTFQPVMPSWVPWPHEVILLTGACELAGAAALLTRRWRWWAGVMLAAYAVGVYPANLKHAWLDIAVAHDYATLWYHVPRLPFQAVLIWWALYAGGVTAWPWRRAPARSP
jgi:uncharacterized membrane protein